MMSRRNRQGGNAILELAIASAVLFPVMAGTFQFGYTFYAYNLLESAVANGGRYAAFRTYRCHGGSTDITKVKTAIKNMTVYSSPAASGDLVPVVRGLTPAAIDVSFTLNAQQIPTAVTVSVNSFTVQSVFQNYTFTGKPRCTIPFLGRYAPEESEP
jgi:Flp pilus assembly protein TadG